MELAEGEKHLFKNKNKSLYVMTKMGEGVGIFGKTLQRGGFSQIEVV